MYPANYDISPTTGKEVMIEVPMDMPVLELSNKFDQNTKYSERLVDYETEKKLYNNWREILKAPKETWTWAWFWSLFYNPVPARPVPVWPPRPTLY